MSNTSRSVFQNIVDNATHNQQPKPLITEAEYTEWKKECMLDGLCGIRYGQSFCNRQGITDHLLYYSLNPEEADRYIREKYIARP